jgi:transposase-like protein
MVLDHASEHPSLWAAVMLISAKIGCTPQALHDWVKKAEVDSGQRAGVPTDTAERLKALERENRELSRWKRSSVVLCSWLHRLSSSQSEAVSAPNDPGNKSRSNENPSGGLLFVVGFYAPKIQANPFASAHSQATVPTTSDVT